MLGPHHIDEDALADEGAYFLEPRETFDRAIIGMAQRCGESIIVAYDANACIAALADANGWDHGEAVEWFEFNTLGAHVGAGTPIFIYRRENEHEDNPSQAGAPD